MRPAVEPADLGSVLAETKLRRGFAGDWILHELAVAFGAKVEPAPLINLFADEASLFLVKSLEDLVDLEQMVAVVIDFVHLDRIHDRLHF